MSTPIPSYTFGSYVAQCASGGNPGPVYNDQYGLNQNNDDITPQAACNNCLPATEINYQNSDGSYIPVVTGPNSLCTAQGAIPVPTITNTSAGYWQGGGNLQNVPLDIYGNPIVTQNQNLFDYNFAGFGGGNASSGLTHTQIALIILLVLLVCGTGGFLLFRHLKK